MKKIPITQRLSLTLPEAAAHSGIGRHNLRRKIDEDPTFPFFLDGKTHRIPRVEFETWISDQAKKSMDC